MLKQMLTSLYLTLVVAFGCLNQAYGYEYDEMPYASGGYGYEYEMPYASGGYGYEYEMPYASGGYSEQPMVDWGRPRKQGFLGASPGKTGPPDSARENRTRAVQAISRDMRLKNPAPSKPLNSREEKESLRTEVRYRRNHPRSSNSRISPKIRPSVRNIDRIDDRRKR